MADVSSRFIGYYHNRAVKLKTSRHIYSSALLNNRAYTWLGQEPKSLYKDYDNISVEAYPYMETRFRTHSKQQLCILSSDPSRSCLKVEEAPFFNNLILAAKKYDNNLEKTQFIFQSVDWRDNVVQKLPDQQLGGAMLRVIDKGARHIGWYPDMYFPDSKYPYISGKFEQAINR